MPVRQELRTNGAISLTRGPLAYALQIAERQEKIKEVDGWADYAYHPESPWNYALATSTADDVAVWEQPLGKIPFDPAHVPVLLDVPVRRVPSWGMKDNSADAPPNLDQIAPETLGEVETVTFVPFGFARLRVTELPQAPNASPKL